MRDRFNDFVSRHDIAWELVMAALAILYLAVGFAIDAAGPDTRTTLEVLEIGLTVIFALEFGTRFLAARDRRAYLRGHWIDLLALIPPVRGARVLRLLRLLRLIRAFAGLYRAAVHVGALTRHRGFAYLIVAWLAVVVLCSTGLYVAEVGVNENINSPFDAFWWGVTTMTTVGYGDIYPVTAEGRIAAIILMVLGISLFSAVTAVITSFLLATGKPASKADGEGVVPELERLTELWTRGALDDGEFAAAKARLLG